MKKGGVGRERWRAGVDHVGLFRLSKICSFFFDEMGGNDFSLLYSRRGISKDHLGNGLSLTECPARSSAPTSLGSLSDHPEPLDSLFPLGIRYHWVCQALTWFPLYPCFVYLSNIPFNLYIHYIFLDSSEFVTLLGVAALQEEFNE